jgi:lipopolysaccharide transport system ATP-binding protein
MSQPIIEISGLGKKYRIGANRGKYLSLREELARTAHGVLRRFAVTHHPVPSQEDFWALKDVSFSVQEGEAVGIIGRNGAGKSTLLKILSQITPPTEGKLTLRGRVASLLEVGTGFHPELTGRENVFLNGAILGMRREEIRRKFDEIVAFAEVEKFLDTPVKRYSSGMYVRLAFAVAAHLEPEILIIDEVLAVGDAQFQKKCLGKMGEVAKQGRTVLFVSHNMVAIEHLCTHCVLLDKGSVYQRGTPAVVTAAYLKYCFMNVNQENIAQRSDRSGDGRAKLCGVMLRDANGCPVQSVPAGSTCSLEFDYICAKPLADLQMAFTVRDSQLQFTFRPSSIDAGFSSASYPQEGKLVCHIQRLPLVPGQYRITTMMLSNDVVTDYLEGAFILNVEGGDFFGTGKMHPHCPVLLDHTWSIEPHDKA